MMRTIRICQLPLCIVLVTSSIIFTGCADNIELPINDCKQIVAKILAKEVQLTQEIDEGMRSQIRGEARAMGLELYECMSTHKFEMAHSILEDVTSTDGFNLEELSYCMRVAGKVLPNPTRETICHLLYEKLLETPQDKAVEFVIEALSGSNYQGPLDHIIKTLEANANENIVIGCLDILRKHDSEGKRYCHLVPRYATSESISVRSAVYLFADKRCPGTVNLSDLKDSITTDLLEEISE